MRHIISISAILFLVFAGGGPRAMAGGPPANQAATAGIYYPPSESAGGWRRCKTDEQVRKLAGMDPQEQDAAN